MPRIFVSYRREDTLHITGRLGDRLRARYGKGKVFVDVNSNEAGVEYQRTTLEALRASDVVLVVIGDRWLGGRRLFRGRRGGIHSPQNLARAEIEAALQVGIPIVPVLVDGARMPELKQLPASIAGLAGIHARRLDGGEDFDHHVTRLIERIDVVVAEASIAVGSDEEYLATRERIVETAARTFAASPPPAGSPWEFPVASIQSDPDESAPEVAAPDTALPDADRKWRLRIAGATAVLVLPLLVLGVYLLHIMGGDFFGMYGASDGFFISISSISAVAIIFIAFRCRRWTALDRLELAAYWLAAGAPVVLGFLAYSVYVRWSIFQLRAGDSGMVIGGLLVLATGLLLLARHWNDWMERELPIYWAGCSASSLAAINAISRSYLPEHAAKVVLLACLLELYVGGVLVWWRRKSLTPHDYVIFWIGVILVGATMSDEIAGLIPWPSTGSDVLALWGAVVALSFVYSGFRFGHRLSLWERALCGVIAAGLFWFNIGALPIASPLIGPLGFVAGVAFLAVVLLPIWRKTVPEMARKRPA